MVNNVEIYKAPFNAGCKPDLPLVALVAISKIEDSRRDKHIQFKTEIFAIRRDIQIFTEF